MPMRIGPMPDGHYAKYWESLGLYCERGEHEICTYRMELAHLEYHLCTCACHQAEEDAQDDARCTPAQTRFRWT